MQLLSLKAGRNTYIWPFADHKYVGNLAKRMTPPGETGHSVVDRRKSLSK
jgi:hypothetical protein